MLYYLICFSMQLTNPLLPFGLCKIIAHAIWAVFFLFNSVAVFVSGLCLCVYLCPFIVKASSSSVELSRNRSTMLCWRRFFPPPSPFIPTLEGSTEPFYYPFYPVHTLEVGKATTYLVCISLSKHKAFS